MSNVDDAAFFKDLDILIKKYSHVGVIHIIGLLDFAKIAILHESDKIMTKLEKGEQKCE